LPGHLRPCAFEVGSRLALPLVRPFGSGSPHLLWPLLTSRSTDDATSPFQAQGEISPGKNAGLPHTTAGSTPPPFGHKSFAISCSLALDDVASDPVLVHRPVGALHASFSPALADGTLRFASVPVARFRGDFHPQVRAHAGRTTQKAATREGCGFLKTGSPCDRLDEQNQRVGLRVGKELGQRNAWRSGS